jgi:hypothetical protein
MKVDAARTVTKSSTGEWNHCYSVGEEEVEYGPQKDCELVKLLGRVSAFCKEANERFA